MLVLEERTRRMSEKYFIAFSSFPSSLISSLEEERKWMRNNYNCSSGQRTKLHITIIPPFTTDFSKEKIKCVLNKVRFFPFVSNIDGFCFFSNRTLFASVKEKDEWRMLGTTIESAIKELEIERKKNDIPHITIANRDIPFQYIIPIRERYINKDMKVSFLVNSFSLFFWNGREWIESEKFRLD